MTNILNAILFLSLFSISSVVFAGSAGEGATHVVSASAKSKVGLATGRQTNSAKTAEHVVGADAKIKEGVKNPK
ncbi:MAG: hypothetical protein SFT91_03110 [Rickettsiaceae bacterium]|nr:hypothetical protein [Rickettsiaceae bacterium]